MTASSQVEKDRQFAVGRNSVKRSFQAHLVSASSNPNGISLWRLGQNRVSANSVRAFSVGAAKILRGIRRGVALMCVLGATLLPVNAQQKKQSATDLLHRALYLADLYNCRTRVC